MPARSHGMSASPTYRRWSYMKRRCASDPLYTQQGIAVCERWVSSFENFLADMGEVPPGLTLDRIDGTKGYEPGNCRWATYKEQNRNITRNRRVGGVVVADIAAETGMSHTAISYRVKRGLDVYALTQAERTTCRAGHPWDEANTHYATVKKKGGVGTRTQRYCRKCRVKHQADLRKRNGTS